MKHILQFLSSLALGLIGLISMTEALAVGQLADIQIVDRESGQTLRVYRMEGRYYVAGRPDSRYSVVLRNRQGERLMSVISIDGINAISGETAAWGQTGYVFGAYESSEITGWRKSLSQVAAFQFAALQDSYAARTGRPAQVGVIGVALFREKRLQPVTAPQSSAPVQSGNDVRGRIETESMRSNAAGEGRSDRLADTEVHAPPAPASINENKALNEDALARRQTAPLEKQESALASKLGTAHGRIETSNIGTTAFDRLTNVPNEIISIYYDSEANLIAQGVIPNPIARQMPQPFPNSGFVPDPPLR